MAQWNPFEDMDALRREIDRTFRDFGIGEEPLYRVAFLPGKGPRRYPMVNMSEDKEALYIEALTPGVDPQSLNITVMQNRLTISGEKIALAGEIKPEAYHRSERASGKFVRAIDLPVEVNEQAIDADYRAGILVLKLPKAEKAKPKQINVTVG